MGYAEAYGENNCVTMAQFANRATSIRLTGVPNGWQFDSFNVYEGELYNGQEQWAFDDAPGFTFDNFGKSMIITGCTPWTLYEYPNYGGQSACWYPADTKNYAEPMPSSELKKLENKGLFLQDN